MTEDERRERVERNRLAFEAADRIQEDKRQALAEAARQEYELRRREAILAMEPCASAFLGALYAVDADRQTRWLAVFLHDFQGYDGAEFEAAVEEANRA